MASRVRLPEGVAAVYNVGLVFTATIGLIMGFLLALQSYTTGLDEAAKMAVPGKTNGQNSRDPLVHGTRAHGP